MLCYVIYYLCYVNKIKNFMLFIMVCYGMLSCCVALRFIYSLNAYILLTETVLHCRIQTARPAFLAASAAVVVLTCCRCRHRRCRCCFCRCCCVVIVVFSCFFVLFFCCAIRRLYRSTCRMCYYTQAYISIVHVVTCICKLFGMSFTIRLYTYTCKSVYIYNI